MSTSKLVLSEKDVPNRSADEIDAFRPVARATRPPRRIGREPDDPSQLCRRCSRRSAEGRRSAPSSARRRSARLTTPTSSSSRRTATRPSSAEVDERPQLGRAARPRGRHDMTAHDPPHGSVREPVADRLVEVLAADAADEAPVVDDEHAALPVPLAERHRVAHGAPGATDRAGVDMTSRARRALRLRAVERLEQPGPRLRRASAARSRTPPARGRHRRARPRARPRRCGSVRLRTTTNTRSSISTRRTSARASVRSTILCARFETPSTYDGQLHRGERTSSPPASTGSRRSISSWRRSRSGAASGVCR